MFDTVPDILVRFRSGLRKLFSFFLYKNIQEGSSLLEASNQKAISDPDQFGLCLFEGLDPNPDFFLSFGSCHLKPATLINNEVITLSGERMD